MSASLEEAIAAHRSGNLQQAEQLYRQILLEQPDHPDALNLLGVLMRQQSRWDQSEQLIRRALAVAPDDPRLAFNLGETLRGSGKYEQAIESYQASLARNPANAPAWHAMGMALEKLRRDEQAIESFTRAISIDPHLMPARQSLIDLLWRLQRLGQAEAAARDAIQVDANWQRGHVSLGMILDRLGRGSEAIAAYRHALQINPDDGLTHGDLANVLADHFSQDEAIAHFRRALELLPQAAAVHSNLLLMLNLDPKVDEPSLFAEHQRWAAQHAAKFFPTAPRPVRDAHPDRSLRIGYLSPDFRNHPIVSFFEPILANHDRKAYVPIMYSDVANPDAATARIAAVAGAENFRAVHDLPDGAVEMLMRQDQIDILVDLAGHTAGNRLLLFARGVAPIQVTYLGYPNTTGLPRSVIQYRITDGDCDPPGASDELHTEELIRLPRTFLCYRPPIDAPAVAPSPCEHNGSVTFGSFCGMLKINRDVVAAWSQILLRVPDSRVLIKNKSVADEDVRRRLLQAFASHGIDAQRIVLRGQDPNPLDHLARYSGIDIALDTFPYNGTTTTCEALWMGVPLVTYDGLPHRSRVSYALVNKLGLAYLAAPSVDRYIELAAELAKDPVRLSHLRSQLRSRMQQSPLRDETSFVRSLENAYRDMWGRACAR